MHPSSKVNVAIAKTLGTAKSMWVSGVVTPSAEQHSASRSFHHFLPRKTQILAFSIRTGTCAVATRVAHPRSLANIKKSPGGARRVADRHRRSDSYWVYFALRTRDPCARGSGNIHIPRSGRQFSWVTAVAQSNYCGRTYKCAQSHVTPLSETHIPGDQVLGSLVLHSSACPTAHSCAISTHHAYELHDYYSISLIVLRTSKGTSVRPHKTPRTPPHHSKTDVQEDQPPQCPHP